MTQYRVLFVVRYLWGDEGISIGLARLAKGLIGEGWEVGLASAMIETVTEDGQEARGPSWFESKGIKHFFVPFPEKKGGIKPKGIFKAYTRLEEVIDEFKPNVINLHSLALAPYLNAIRLAKGIPFVSTARIEPSKSRSGVRLASYANKVIKNFSGDRFIAISTEVKNVYSHHLNIPEGRIRLVNHGVDETHFRPPSLDEKLAARKQFDLEPDEHVVCLVGRLDPVKGHDVLFRAIAYLKSQGIQVTALCAGKGGDFEEAIKAEPRKLEIEDSVRFLGFTDPRLVLWVSDILALPSRREGFGWVIPEAMLCGVVPVRTPSAGAVDQINNGVDGFITPFDDHEHLALTLRRLFTDKDLIAKVAEKGIESARNKFTSSRMVENTIQVYEELI